MISRSEIQEGIDKLFVNYRIDLEEEKIKDMITLWHEKFKYWKLNDFNAVIDRVVKESKFMPKIANMWAIYKEMALGRKTEKIKTVYLCERCKDTGVRSFIREDEIQAGYCPCDTGKAIFKNNSLLPYIELELSKKGTKEYPIHTNLGSFTGHIPEGIGYKLSKEICGKEHFMYKLTEQLETGEIPAMGAVRGLIKKEPDDEDELPF